ncbi:ADP-ribosylation factor-like 6, arl6 [Schistosoma mansoni]|uniref:ADP-ribosylation factor-like 6, arl6 n=1 Tax=Schistosoma mansoni TaxID=6183 RepID=UPI0001A62DA5|nr:ADP-ribosylation factor-like 6, arl6 [Schistosoma mansoni]|eukprot:XP_018650083.1 ADP-ribosylation factor-like 6, arl6 [Schistosoma mansoni]
MWLFEIISKMFSFLKKEVKVLVIGLDNSGKSTILNKLQSKETQNSLIVPTIGYNVEKIRVSQMMFLCFDMSGSGTYRNLWEKFYKECEAIIYVVDSSDELRLTVVEDEFQQLLKHPDICNRRIPILLFANKMDLSNSITVIEIVKILGLEKLRNKSWRIFASNAINGEGLNEGLMWLFGQLKQSTN